MGQFDPRYTDAERRAVALAVVDGGLSGPQTQRAAARGELDLPPFDMPLGTIYRLAREERQRRDRNRFQELARTQPREAAEVLLERELAILERECEEMHRQVPIDMDRFMALVRATSWIARSLPQPRGGTTPPKTSANNATDRMDQLLQEARQQP